jgi:hypothetical protein
MEFIDYLQDIFLENKIISIIGLAKNVSKTTTLNHIIKLFSNRFKLGLTSIGRDGEKYDILSKFPKPRIIVDSGTIFATAQESINNSQIKTEIIRNTGISTPMGEVLIFKALSNGFIELAGPSNNTNLKLICSEMLDLGCDLIIIDGAFDRKSFASPIISDATILSTGASVSEDMKNVVDITTHIIKLLSMDYEKDQEIQTIAKQLLMEFKVGLINQDHSIEGLDLLTALNSAEEIANSLTKNTQFITIKGAITDRFLESLMKVTQHYKYVTILVENGTKLFINAKTLNKFQKKGGKIKVLHPIKIIAITINPTSPYGYQFNKNKFFELLQHYIKIPIYDLGPNKN